jgi:hypothetical protein
MPGVVQVGVARERWFALRIDGSLVAWDGDAATAQVLMAGVQRFAAGHSGWFAIDRAGVLWQAPAGAARHSAWPTAWPRPASATVPTTTPARRCAVRQGPRAPRPVRRRQAARARRLRADRRRRGGGEGAHRPRDPPAPRRHVMGTGGNRFGPLSSHGLGDKADRWGRLFDGRWPSPPARAIRWRSAPMPRLGLGRGLRHRAGPHHGRRGQRGRGRHRHHRAQVSTARCGSGTAAARHAGCRSADPCGPTGRRRRGYA